LKYSIQDCFETIRVSNFTFWIEVHDKLGYFVELEDFLLFKVAGEHLETSQVLTIVKSGSVKDCKRSYWNPWINKLEII